MLTDANVAFYRFNGGVPLLADFCESTRDSKDVWIVPFHRELQECSMKLFGYKPTREDTVCYKHNCAVIHAPSIYATQFMVGFVDWEQDHGSENKLRRAILNLIQAPDAADAMVVQTTECSQHQMQRLLPRLMYPYSWRSVPEVTACTANVQIQTEVSSSDAVTQTECMDDGRTDDGRTDNGRTDDGRNDNHRKESETQTEEESCDTDSDDECSSRHCPSCIAGEWFEEYGNVPKMIVAAVAAPFATFKAVVTGCEKECNKMCPHLLGRALAKAIETGRTKCAEYIQNEKIVDYDTSVDFAISNRYSCETIERLAEHLDSYGLGVALALATDMNLTDAVASIQERDVDYDVALHAAVAKCSFATVKALTKKASPAGVGCALARAVEVQDSRKTDMLASKNPDWMSAVSCPGMSERTTMTLVAKAKAAGSTRACEIAMACAADHGHNDIVTTLKNDGTDVGAAMCFAIKNNMSMTGIKTLAKVARRLDMESAIELADELDRVTLSKWLAKRVPH